MHHISVGVFPPEVLEMIFSHLPLFNLLCTCSRVCKQWHYIISQDKFLKWRKLYFKFKLNSVIEGKAKELNHPSRIYSSFKSPIDQDPLSWLIFFTDDFFKGKSDLFIPIKKHIRYEQALRSLNHIWQDVAISETMVSTWLFLTSSSVWVTRDIIRQLINKSENGTTLVISEYLYMLCSFLLMFQRNSSLPTRTHYNLFHALYLLENEWLALPSEGPNSKLLKKTQGQQSLMSLGFSRSVPSKVPTAEQQRIIQHPLIKGKQDLIKIVAFAGTGKTTTLVKLATANPNLKFLLVVYNKSVRILAETMFPKSNVVCKTVHQMAMSKCGFIFSKKLTSNLKAKDILDSGLLADNENSDSGLYRRAGQVLATLSSFMNSPDLRVEMEHVPSVWNIGSTVSSLSSAERILVLQDAEVIWNAMCDKEDFRIRMPHDGYLKLWQVRSPNLQKVSLHDVLLLDEGQDMNPAMLNIFMNQKVSRIIVGDPHQQIYTFRGAINALDIVKPTHTYFLTQSFRFGPEIAFVANKCLVGLKGRDEMTLVGGKKTDTYLATKIEWKKQIALIGRTNLGIFETMNSLIFKSGSKKIGLVGGTESYNFEDYLDLYHLMMGEHHKMKKFKGWKSYAQFKTFASNVNDVELLGKIKILEKFGDRLPIIIDRIKSFACKDIRMADIVLSTVHKAKGLEFETVVLLDDFPDFTDEYGRMGQIGEDEMNLVYVAITRAKSCLVMNNLVKEDILENDGLDKIVIYQGGGNEVQCDNAECKVDLSDNLQQGQAMVRAEAHLMSSKELISRLASGYAIEDLLKGPFSYCLACSSTKLPSFRRFFETRQENRGIKRKR